MNPAPPFGVNIALAVLVGLAFLVALALVSRRSRGALVLLSVLLVVAVAGATLTWYTARIAPSVPLPERSDGASPPRRVVTNDTVHARIAAPDDASAWQLFNDAERLAFQPLGDAPDPWLAAGTAPGLRREIVVGTTSFLLWEPAPGGFVVGLSDVEASKDMAEQVALQHAVEKLAVLATARLAADRRPLDPAAALPLARSLASRPPHLSVLDARVEQGQISSGNQIFRAAVRIAAGEAVQKALAADVARQVDRGWLDEQAELRKWFWTALALIVVAFVLFLAYTFLNAGTKGYFAWPLRIASILIFALFVCCCWYLVRMNLGSP